MAVIIISDDIPEVLQNCNRVLVMKKGRMVEQLETANITEHAIAAMLSES